MTQNKRVKVPPRVTMPISWTMQLNISEINYQLERFSGLAVGETGDSKLVGSCISRLILGDIGLVVAVVLLLLDPTGTFMSEYRKLRRYHCV